MKLRPFETSENGQIMVGFYVGIIALMGIAVIVMSYMSNMRKVAAKREWNDLALQVAHAGFEDAMSYFRLQPDGVYLPPSIRPVDQMAVTPWPSWPDDAFRPSSTDTDFYLPVTTFSNTFCAAAIIHDFPLHVSRTVASGSDLLKGGVWGRYIVKRQVQRDWSPGGNTFAAFKDPDAAHDITDARDFSSSAALGTGNFWAITALGYVYLGSGNQAVGVSDDVTLAASTVANSLTSSPCASYPPCNGATARPLLLAKAKVYGELFRINYSAPDAAVFIAKGSNISGNSLGLINGTSSGTAVARNDATTVSGGVMLSGAASYLAAGYSPSVATVFPGLDKAKLKGLANYVGDTSIFPNLTSTSFSDAISQVAFYYVKNASSPSTAFTFTQAMNNRLQGTGLVFVDGSLSCTAGCVTGWNGVIFVDGDVYLNEGAAVYGQVITTGKLSISGFNSKGQVQFNAAVRDTVQSLIQGFKVYKPSVVTSYN